MFNENRFNAQLALIGMSKGELAERMGIDKSTLYRKIKDNGRFDREEIRDLIAIMRIEPKDVDAIFFEA